MAYCLTAVISINNHLKVILQEIPQPLFTKISLKTNCFKFYSNFRGVSWRIWSNSTCTGTEQGVHHVHTYYIAPYHYIDVIMSGIASQITGVSNVYVTVCSGVDKKKHRSSALLALCAGNPPVTGEFPAQRASNGENVSISLHWCHNGRDSISNHQPHDCFLNRLFRHRSKKISKLRVTTLFAGNSPVTGEFPAQRTSNAENVSIWWRHHMCL